MHAKAFSVNSSNYPLLARDTRNALANIDKITRARIFFVRVERELRASLVNASVN